MTRARRRSRPSRCALVAALSVAAALAPGCASPARFDGSARQPGSPCVAPPPRSAAHASFACFVREHLSGEAWREGAVREGLGGEAAVLPVALASTALLVRASDTRTQRRIEGTWGRSSGVGDAGQAGLAISALALGWFRPGPGRDAVDETWDQAEALALTFGATEGLKAATGRRRPHGQDRASFPSGHSAAAFCAATLIERDEGPVLGALAYGIASVTAFSRVEAGKHFPSDVLAGAALGTAVASLVDALHFSPEHGICRPSWTPTIGPGEDGGTTIGVSIDL